MPSARHSLYYAAQLAELAYLGSTVFGGVKLQLYVIPETGTQFLIGRDGDCIILAFRGSDERKDWRNNFRFLPRRVKGLPGWWHRGFWKAFDPARPLIKEKILALMEERNCKRILISGHSLGGALAVLAALRVAQEFKWLDLDPVTFGAPAVGSRAAARYMSSLFTLRRVRNNADIVPLSTVITFMRHFGELIYFDRDGRRHINPSTWFRFRDRWGLWRERVEDHEPEDYVDITRGY